MVFTLFYCSLHCPVWLSSLLVLFSVEEETGGVDLGYRKMGFGWGKWREGKLWSGCII